MGGKARSDRRGDATADVPHRGYAQAFWLQAADQVVENAVRNIFVKDAFVAEAPQVQLQALQLEDLRSWDVRDGERCEVGLAGHRADARELGAHALSLVVPIGMRVRDDDHIFRRLRRHFGRAVYSLAQRSFRVRAALRGSALCGLGGALRAPLGPVVAPLA